MNQERGSELPLAQLLRERAGDVDGLPAPADLGPRVVARGRTVRRRRRALAAGGGALAVAASVVAVALGAVPGLSASGPTGVPSVTPTRTSAPVPTGSPTSSSTDPTPQPTRATGTATGTDQPTVVDPALGYLKSLPVGRPLGITPRADYVGGRVVLTSTDGEIRLPAGINSVFDPVHLPAGWAFWAHSDSFTGGGPDEGQALFLLAPGNKLRTLYRGPFQSVAFSPDGSRYALAQVGLGAYDPVNVVVRRLDGTVLASLTRPNGTYLTGWGRAGVLLAVTPTGADHVENRWWQPGSALGAALPDDTVLPVPQNQDRALVQDPTADSAGAGCWSLLDLITGQRGPKVGCGSAANGATVSPDGRFAVIGSTAYDLSVGGDGRGLLGDVTTQFIGWEDATHLLAFYPVDPTTTLYARCDVGTGACEQAPAPTANGTPVAVAWYR